MMARTKSRSRRSRHKRKRQQRRSAVRVLYAHRGIGAVFLSRKRLGKVFPCFLGEEVGLVRIAHERACNN
jgi:hypothetical protein